MSVGEDLLLGYEVAVRSELKRIGELLDLVLA